jgi:RecA/RadA recombinase
MASSAARDLLARLGFPAALRLGTAAGGTPPVPRLGLRIDALDVALGGGFPRGRLSEIVGPPSCGKTALLYGLLAAATARGEVVALVDLADAFSPPAAAAAGIDLACTLWVRPPSVIAALRCTELLLDAGGFGVVAVDLGSTKHRPRFENGTWPRLARAVERSGTVAAVLARERVTGTCSTLGLALRPLDRHWSRRGRGPILFDGFDAEVTLVRNRLGIGTDAVRISAA